MTRQKFLLAAWVIVLPSITSAQKWVREGDIDGPLTYNLRYEAEPARLAKEAERRPLSESELAEVAGSEYARFSFVVARLDARREGSKFATTERLPGRGDLWLTRAAEKLAYAGDEIRTDAWKWTFYDEFGRYAVDAWEIATQGDIDPQLLAWAELDQMRPNSSHFAWYFGVLKKEPLDLESRLDYLINAYRLDVGYDEVGFPQVAAMGQRARDRLVAKLKAAHEQGEDVRWIASMAVVALGAVGDPRVREIPREWLPSDRPAIQAYYAWVIDNPPGEVDVGMMVPARFLAWSGCIQGHGPFNLLGSGRRPSQDAWERAHPTAKTNRATGSQP